MLINLDAKQLEWVCAAYLSKDKVAYDEINAGVDLHSDNQKRFGLPTRTLAKVFLFRLIYGGSAFAFSLDPEFTSVSSSSAYWQSIIDEAYNKYGGLGQWHSRLMQEVTRNDGLLIVPATHRMYKIPRENGEFPRPKVLNYPVQGLGHDLMACLRCILAPMIWAQGPTSLLVSTVHDSVLLDVPADLTLTTCQQIFQATELVPLDFKRRFGVEFDLPFRVEVKVGPNWGSMTEVTKENVLTFS